MQGQAKHETADAAARLRALKAVAAGRNSVGISGKAGIATLSDGTGAAMAVEIATLDSLARRGLLVRRGVKLALSSEGKALLRRALAEVDPFQEQHRDTQTIVAPTPDGPAQARVNLAESPLGQLMRRRNRDGTPFLSDAEWRAGEKLRADYTRGQIMPRLGANWDAAISTGRRAGASSDLSDGALSARMRVERAIDAVGPELSGVLIDVCCFLKGLETVEAERRWPARSAKIVLKSALGVLSRHYDPRAATSSRRRPVVLNWGAADYRPSIGG